MLTPPTLVKVLNPQQPYVLPRFAAYYVLTCFFLGISVLMHLSRVTLAVERYLFSDRTRTGYCKLLGPFESNCCHFLVSMSMSSASTSSLLSYPVSQPEPSTSTSLPRSTPPRELLKNRLYVGNLHPTVDECALISLYIRVNKAMPNRSLLAPDTPSSRSSPNSGSSRVSITSFTRPVRCAASPEATPL